MNLRMTLGLGIAAAVSTGGCAAIGIWSAPEKSASAERTPLALKADALFWQTLHGGQYEKIPEALTAVTAAYLENPRDAVTAAHVGWLHIWRLAERARIEKPPPGLTDHVVLSRRYFEEAVRLNPGEARYLGFYGSTLLTEGSIHKDEKLTRKGYYTLLDSIKAWPEFNYFTVGYTMSAQPQASERFQDALEYQWLNLDVCVGEKVDRKIPDYRKYMHLDTKEGAKRVCWNSWIAPHNFEGFFLNFGDMLVKNGQPELAVTMYRNATYTPEYAAWPYRKMLEDRMQNAASNVEAFRKGGSTSDDTRLMVQTRFACMGCHQR